MEHDEASGLLLKKGLPAVARALEVLALGSDLALLLTESCELCGRKFCHGEEFFLLKRVRFHDEGGFRFGEVVTESAMCIMECGGVDIVKI